MKQIKGQLSIFDLEQKPSILDTPRAPIYHMSLTAVWNECPNCKVQPSNIGDTKMGVFGMYIEQNERCPHCGQLLDWDDAAVEKACKYSSDYRKAMEERYEKAI